MQMRLTGTGVPSVSSLSSCLKHSTLLQHAASKIQYQVGSAWWSKQYEGSQQHLAQHDWRVGAH